MSKGWVYIASNPDIQDKIKIGFSERDPEKRIQEFEQAGLPSKYELEYQILVDDPYRLEQSVHAHLSDYHENKEWFNCTVEEAVASILDIYQGEVYLEIDNQNLRYEAKKLNEEKRKKQNEIIAINQAKQAQIDLENEKSKREFDKIKKREQDESDSRKKIIFCWCVLIGLPLACTDSLGGLPYILIVVGAIGAFLYRDA